MCIAAVVRARVGMPGGRRAYNMTMRFMIFLAVLLATSPASAACLMSYCEDEAPKRSYIRNNWESGGQIVGDIYDPGGGQRLQVRDASRRLVGYIERSGRITNVNRQEKGSIEPFIRTED